MNNKIGIILTGLLASLTGCISTGNLPYTYPQNITTLQDVYLFGNAATNNLFGIIIVGFMWVFMFLHFLSSGYSPSKCVAGSSGIMLIVSTLFWSIGLVDIIPIMFLLMTLLISGLYLYFTK